MEALHSPFSEDSWDVCSLSPGVEDMGCAGGNKEQSADNDFSGGFLLHMEITKCEYSVFQVLTNIHI